MKRYHYWIRSFCSVIVGLVFFISGILKISDPVGATLIVREYLSFFHLDFLLSLDGVIAIFFASIETITGVALVTAVYKKIFAFISFLLTGFFLIVTLILLIFNPSMDCGCFGELIHLTHLQSFLKNVALSLLVCVAFLPFRDFGNQKVRKVIAFWTIISLAALLLLHSLLYRPLVDLTPFKKASTLDVVMSEIDKDVSESAVTLIYAKDGAEAKFALDALPDSSWTYIRTESTLNLNKQENPKLEFRDHEGNYLDSLASAGRVMVVSVYDIEKVNEEQWSKILSLFSGVKTLGINPILLVSATSSMVQALVPAALASELYYCDYRTLVSLNRSNGGAVLFDDGILIRKWSNRALTAAQANPNRVYLGEIGFQALLLLMFVLML